LATTAWISTFAFGFTRAVHVCVTSIAAANARSGALRAVPAARMSAAPIRPAARTASPSRLNRVFFIDFTNPGLPRPQEGRIGQLLLSFADLRNCRL
jgi:hypothetical protein